MRLRARLGLSSTPVVIPSLLTGGGWCPLGEENPFNQLVNYDKPSHMMYLYKNCIKQTLISSYPFFDVFYILPCLQQCVCVLNHSNWLDGVFFMCSGQDRGGMTSVWGRTPFGSQTPMVGSMTPSYGSMTPLHGSTSGGRTPMYGSQTPQLGDGEAAWKQEGGREENLLGGWRNSVRCDEGVGIQLGGKGTNFVGGGRGGIHLEGEGGFNRGERENSIGERGEFSCGAGVRGIQCGSGLIGGVMGYNLGTQEVDEFVLLFFNVFYCCLQGGRTPNYGHMTPSHDPFQTPQHGGSAWDPSIANTPARSA